MCFVFTDGQCAESERERETLTWVRCWWWPMGHFAYTKRWWIIGHCQHTTSTANNTGRDLMAIATQISLSCPCSCFLSLSVVAFCTSIYSCCRVFFYLYLWCYYCVLVSLLLSFFFVLVFVFTFAVTFNFFPIFRSHSLFAVECGSSSCYDRYVLCIILPTP